MADIPAGGVEASAAQAGYQAREAARAKDAGAAGRANAANRQTKAVDEAASSVDTEDNDTQIYADAEGTGSQGRSLQEEGQAEPGVEPSEASTEGITQDEDGQLHLDLEA
jgi:hypothetical protein